MKDFYTVEGVPGLVSNIKVYGLDDSIRRAKFPMQTNVGALTYEITDGIKKLAQTPIGSGHDQWLTGVVVQFDLTFSNKAWVELQRYHFIDFVSSQSTMHRITRFDLSDAYNEYVDPRIIEIMREKVAEYNNYSSDLSAGLVPQEEGWLRESEQKRRELYLGILYSNPAGFMLTAGLTTNYRQLKTVYKQRHDHRLPEWRAFCEWMKTLPKSNLIIPELDIARSAERGESIEYGKKENN